MYVNIQISFIHVSWCKIQGKELNSVSCILNPNRESALFTINENLMLGECFAIILPTTQERSILPAFTPILCVWMGNRIFSTTEEGWTTKILEWRSTSIPAGLFMGWLEKNTRSLTTACPSSTHLPNPLPRYRSLGRAKKRLSSTGIASELFCFVSQRQNCSFPMEVITSFPYFYVPKNISFQYRHVATTN